MKFNAGYFFRETLRSSTRNWTQSFVAISTVAICMMVLGAFSIVIRNMNNVIKHFENKVEIVAYLKDAASQNDIDRLQQKILGWPEVKKVDYVSKEDAWEKFKELMKDQPDIIRNISRNPLPASLEIKLKNPRVTEGVADRLKDDPAIEEIRYGQEFIKKLFTFTRFLYLIGAVLTGVLSVAVLMLISNTIRLSIFARRKEIAIMKLVGATNWFIRWPFVLEGMLQGLIGALLAIILIVLANKLFIENLVRQMPFLPLTLTGISVIKIFMALISTGIVIGAIGSALALRRHLKV